MWIKTSDRKPTGDEPICDYPFVTEEDTYLDPHFGSYRVGIWFCRICDKEIAPNRVVAWFDLPPYEGGIDRPC